MSPKQITRLAVLIAAASLVGVALMALVQPGWGLWNWWPVIGLGVSLLLLVVSFLRGAYLTAMKRANMVDLLNDCYTGATKETR